MTRYLLKVLWGQLRHAKTLYLLTILGVALGVGSVLSIQIINQNALSAFAGSVRAVSGEADLSVVGKTPALDENTLPRVLGTPGVAAAWPLYRIQVALAGDPEVFLEIIGVDLFVPIGLPLTRREDSTPGTSDVLDNLREALTRPGWVAVSPLLAEERGWGVGDSLAVTSGSRTAVLRIGALVDFQRYTPFASRKMAVMDISQAQGLLGRAGEIHQVDIKRVEGIGHETLRRRLEDRLGPGVLVRTAEEQQRRAKGLLEAFRVNLTALSLISLFVGLFLIYSSTQASLVRRRTEFGMLRSLGATNRQVLGLILGEVALLGGLGTVIGIPLGYYAAQSNVDMVSSTLTNIYLLQEIERLDLPPRLHLLAAAIGVGGSLLGALLPALDVSRKDTRSLLVSFTLHEKASRMAPALAVVSLALLLSVGGWFVVWGHPFRAGGFGLGLAILIALPLSTPQFIRILCGRVRNQGFGFFYGFKALALKLQTTAVAVAALGVAVSMLVGITLLVGGFRKTLETWVATSIRADVYITTQSWAREGRLATLSDELVRKLSTYPGVTEVEKLRQFRVYSGDREIRLAGARMVLGEGYRIPLRYGDPEAAKEALLHRGAALVSEPLARKEGYRVGDSLRVFAPGGETVFPIAGISYDYSSDQGAALVDLETMDRAFGPGPINNIALYLADGVDVEETVDALKADFLETPLLIRSNRQLREEVFRIFDQTFAVTRILQLMALLVAVSGISLTLLVLARERAAELALYRALGSLRRQIFFVFLGEGLALGALGLVLGLVGGVALASILIYVINPAYFGWTIRPSWPWTELAQEAITILVAAGLAGLYPALRASRVPAQELSRDDV